MATLVTKLVITTLVFTACVFPFAAQADTLSSIAASKVIKVGIREGAPPFAYFDDGGRPKGYAVDLCERIVGDIKAEPGMRDLRIEYVPVKSAERLPFLLNGKIDLECGSSTNTKDRQEKLAVSFNIFYAGVRMLTTKQSAIADWGDLNDRRVALQKGASTAALFAGVAREKNIGRVSIVDVTSAQEGYDAVARGTADAFVTDDILLYSQISRNRGQERMQVTGRPLSVEPYAILMRKGDEPLRAKVNRSLTKIFATGDIFAIYRKWLQTPELSVPMSNILKESIRQPSDFHAYPW